MGYTSFCHTCLPLASMQQKKLPAVTELHATSANDSTLNLTSARNTEFLAVLCDSGFMRFEVRALAEKSH